MKIKYIFGIFAYVLVVSFFSCSHYDQLQKNPRESNSGGESHNPGQNCNDCHNNNGIAGPNWWIVAGTAYKTNGAAQTQATIELWEKPNKQGKLIKTLKSDRKGNFYTDQILNFMGGCYPSITVGSNTLRMDTTQYNGGSCNSCHGITRARITID